MIYEFRNWKGFSRVRVINYTQNKALKRVSDHRIIQVKYIIRDTKQGGYDEIYR